MVKISEVQLYGDVVLRFLSFDSYSGPFLPGFDKATEDAPQKVR